MTIPLRYSTLTCFASNLKDTYPFGIAKLESTSFEQCIKLLRISFICEMFFVISEVGSVHVTTK